MEKLRINKEYAKKYEERKKKEELSKLREKYGDVEEDDSESSEEEDENAEAITKEAERDFFRTLSLLKGHDPSIYNKDTVFFKEKSDDDPKKSAPATKPMYLKDYERERLLDKGSEAFVDSSDDEKPRHHQVKTFDEEQAELKQSVIEAAADSDDSDGDFLIPRKKTKEEKEEEERDYTEWLKGHKSKEPDDMEALEPLRRYWNNPDLDENEAFLRDYILNRGYVDKEASRIPSYDEIIAEDDEDEEAVEEQEKFERKYNFRFEEPDAEFIKRFPRVIPTSVRQKDDSRVQKRKAREQRKQEEKEKKREELKRLKKLKRHELEEKLVKIEELTGVSVGLDTLDIDGDFDPEAYDRKMQEVFNDEYYAEGEDSKPEFEDFDDEDDNWEGYDGEKTGCYGDYVEADAEDSADNGPHVDDPDFNMDADYDPNTAPQRSRKKKGRQRGGSHFAEKVMQEKPVFDPDSTSFENYVEECYKLDFEDLIDGMPCRFNYRTVLPNSFGLSTEEILTCQDRELNEWASLKKAVQYRTDDEERKDFRKYRKRNKDFQRKKRILHSLFESETEEGEKADHKQKQPTDGHTKPRKSKKRKQPAEEGADETITEGGGLQERTASLPPKKKQKHFTDASKSKEFDGRFGRKKVKNKKEKMLAGVSAGRLEAFGLTPAGKESHKKKKKKQPAEEEGANEMITEGGGLREGTASLNPPKKKRKHFADASKSKEFDGRLGRKKVKNKKEKLPGGVSAGRLEAFGLTLAGKESHKKKKWKHKNMD